MPTITEDLTLKADKLEIETKTKANINEPHKQEENNSNGAKAEETKIEKVLENQLPEEQKNDENKSKDDEVKKEEEKIPDEVEPKTGVSFPVKLEDGKKLNAVGLRKKSMLGVGIKIYGFGIYSNNEKLKDLLKSKFMKAPSKPTKEMYQLVIDSDADMLIRLVIVFSSLTISMVRKNFDEGLGASIKKLTGGKNEALTKTIMGEATDDIKLTSGSVIEISRLPGYILQTKVKGEVVSTVESELLCRAFINMYLGDDPFDKEAKEKFGMSLLSLF